jgi:Tetracyclin repressor-like, C-terminal domain
VLARHAGGVELFAESDYTPAAARLIERTVAHLMSTGLPAPLAGSAVRATVTLVFGNAAQTAAGDFWPELLLLAQPPRAFPAVHADADGWTAEADEQFKRQLALLLDGIGAQVA